MSDAVHHDLVGVPAETPGVLLPAPRIFSYADADDARKSWLTAARCYLVIYRKLPVAGQRQSSIVRWVGVVLVSISIRYGTSRACPERVRCSKHVRNGCAHYSGPQRDESKERYFEHSHETSFSDIQKKGRCINGSFRLFVSERRKPVI